MLPDRLISITRVLLGVTFMAIQSDHLLHQICLDAAIEFESRF